MALNAIMIQSAMRKQAHAETIARKWLEQNQLKAVTPEQRASAQTWANMNVQLDESALNDVFDKMYASGYAFGIEDAKGALSSSYTMDWDSWKPGNAAAALLVDSPNGLDNLLRASKVEIKGINETTLNRIGSALSLSLSEGLGAKETAKAINYVLNDPARALTIARTETARALITANQAEYRAAGVEQIEWLVGDPCKICAVNAGAIVAMGQAFPSGALAPPAHPNCVCDIAPVIDEEPNPISQGRVLNDGEYVSKPDLNDLANDKAWNETYLKGGYSPKEGTKLRDVYDRYGYHDKPLVDAKEFDRLKDSGQPVIYRGVKDADDITVAQIQEAFKTSDKHYAGSGYYGNGTYTSTVRSTAIEYADGLDNDLLEMVIRPDAKIIDWKALKEMRQAEITALQQQRNAAIEAVKEQLEREGDTSIAELGRRTKEINKEFQQIDLILSRDESAYAVSRGYDIVDFNLANIKEEHYYIILNRSAVVVNG
jgi:hypothetical protein